MSRCNPRQLKTQAPNKTAMMMRCWRPATVAIADRQPTAKGLVARQIMIVTHGAAPAGSAFLAQTTIAAAVRSVKIVAMILVDEGDVVLPDCFISAG